MKSQWIKKGLIYQPPFDGSWRDNSALTPTPIIINDKIRIYFGARDTNGISRITYVDLNPENPSEIIYMPHSPVLDCGSDGSFDDNGIILGDVIQHEDKFFMFYIGFQIVKKAKFLAFTGLATSKDNGDSFQRLKVTPLLDMVSVFSLELYTLLCMKKEFGKRGIPLEVAGL